MLWYMELKLLIFLTIKYLFQLDFYYFARSLRKATVGPQWKIGDLWFIKTINKMSEVRTGMECIVAIVIPEQNKTVARNLFSQKFFESWQMIIKIRNFMCWECITLGSFKCCEHGWASFRKGQGLFPILILPSGTGSLLLFYF